MKFNDKSVIWRTPLGRLPKILGFVLVKLGFNSASSNEQYYLMGKLIHQAKKSLITHWRIASQITLKERKKCIWKHANRTILVWDHSIFCNVGEALVYFWLKKIKGRPKCYYVHCFQKVFGVDGFSSADKEMHRPPSSSKLLERLPACSFALQMILDLWQLRRWPKI